MNSVNKQMQERIEKLEKAVKHNKMNIHKCTSSTYLQERIEKIEEAVKQKEIVFEKWLRLQYRLELLIKSERSLRLVGAPTISLRMQINDLREKLFFIGKIM